MRTVIALAVLLALSGPAVAETAGALMPASGVSASAEAPVVLSIRLKDRAAIHGHWILLGDIAGLSGPSETRLRELAGLRIAHVPMPGVEKAVSPEEVRRRLRSVGVRETAEFGGMTESVRVTAAMKALAGQDLVRFGHEYLESKAARPGAVVLIEDPDVPRALTVPDAEVEMRAEVSARRLAGLVPVTVEAWSGGERVARVMLSYHVRARVTAIQTARAIEAGAVLAEGDLEDVEADLAEVPEDAVTTRQGLVGQRVIRPMSPGTWVRRASVAQPLQVRRGAQVMLVARIGKVEARASAQAKEEGASGDIITVVNLNSKRILRARVVGVGMVEAVIP